MKFLLVILALIVPTFMWGQTITISGKISDRTTQEPLGFASVSIKGKPVGTISNLQGEFDFHFSSEYRNEILVVSMIGYSNFEAPVWSLVADGIQNIFLDNSITLLPEVTVVDSLTGGEILRIALSRINQNYPEKPFMMNAFYRDTKKVGGTYISLLEAAVQIYDEDYAEPRNKFKLRERVRLVEVRKSIGYENKYTTYFDQDNMLEDLLLHNNIRYRQIEANEHLFEGVVREKNSYYNGHNIYVLTSDQEYYLKIFIDKQDFAIVHLEFETCHADDQIDKKKDVVSKFGGLRKIIDFKRYNDKMYLNYMTITSKVNWYDTQSQRLMFETELHQQLLVNQIYPETTERIGSSDRMKTYGLQYQDLPYNKKFWSNYNVIKETPLDKEILSDLEKHAPLEAQFQDTN